MDAVRHEPGTLYPFKPQCACGQAFRGYLTRTAALIVREAHQCKEDK